MHMTPVTAVLNISELITLEAYVTHFIIDIEEQQKLQKINYIDILNYNIFSMTEMNFLQ